jgi:tetratricopeptide (TPR) repeat protein
MKFGLLFISLLLATSLYSAEGLDIAKAALHDQLYDIAEVHAKKQLEASDGKSTEALALLVEALCQQGQDKRALEVLGQYSNTVARAEQPAWFSYWKARALLNVNQFSDAVLTLQQAPLPTADPALADALLRLTARAKRATGDVVGALEIFASIESLSTNISTRVSNIVEWALTLESAQRESQALEVLSRLLKMNSPATEVSEGLLLRSRLLLRQGKQEEALTAYDQLATNQLFSSRIRVQALTEMSDIVLRQAKTNEAIATARQAYSLAQEPDMRRLAGFHLSNLLCADISTLNECALLIKTLVREFPDDPLAMQAHLKLADSFLRYRLASRAADEYRLVLETYPASSKSDHVLLGRGWALFQLKRYTEASGVFQRVAEQTTNQIVKAESLFKWGDALMADGRYADAAPVFARVTAETPRSPLSPRALYQRGECLERSGQPTLAIAAYQKLISEAPQNTHVGKALLRLGALYVSNGDLDAAIRAYTSIQTNAILKANQCDAYMGRGNVYYRLFRFDAAMKDFAAAGQADATRRDEALQVITRCLYALGRDKEAQASAQTFITEFPESSRLPDMILWIGKFDFNRGKYAEARKMFMEYVSRWPTAEWADAALLWAARAAVDDADFSSAVELVARLVREYPKSQRIMEARLIQTNALMELARFSEAILLLDQIIATDPSGEWAEQAKLRKGDSLFAMGADNPDRYLKALATFREVLQSPSLSASQILQLNYKVARCLEKLKRIDEAIDAYYSDVVIRYQNGIAQGVWYDDSAAGLYLRAAFNVSDLYEQKGRVHSAIKVLERVLKTDVQGKDEIHARIERLRKK